MRAGWSESEGKEKKRVRKWRGEHKREKRTSSARPAGTEEATSPGYSDANTLTSALSSLGGKKESRGSQSASNCSKSRRVEQQQTHNVEAFSFATISDPGSLLSAIIRFRK